MYISALLTHIGLLHHSDASGSDEEEVQVLEALTRSQTKRLGAELSLDLDLALDQTMLEKEQQS